MRSRDEAMLRMDARMARAQDALERPIFSA
jgi:hypothetical protein